MTIIDAETGRNSAPLSSLAGETAFTRLPTVGTGRDCSRSSVGHVRRPEDRHQILAVFRDPRLWAGPSTDSRVHAAPATVIVFSSRLPLIAAAGHDGTARNWHLLPRAELVTRRGHRGCINSVAFSPDAPQHCPRLPTTTPPRSGSRPRRRPEYRHHRGHRGPDLLRCFRAADG